MVHSKKPFGSYDEAFAYIQKHTNYERMRASSVPKRRDAFDLARVRRVLDALGKPDARYPILHVAGTKGKGSVCAMVAAVLKQQGLRVGLFTKPHLLDLRERIAVDGVLISPEAFVEGMNALHPHLEEQRRRSNPLTFFDLIVVLALWHFAREGADVAVLETGLGGRLDSTNVVQPAACAITSIDYDHTHILGDTLEQIAAEKAGILKPGVPAVSGVVEPGPARVIEARARELDAACFRLGREFRLIDPKDGGPFAVETWRRRYAGLSVPLLGAHQRTNAAVAVAALEAFAEATGQPLGEGDVREGLKSVRLRGRVEVLSRVPGIVLDVAHNPSSLRALRQALLEGFPDRRVVLLFALSDDKDAPGCLREILAVASHVVFTTTGQPRSHDPHELQGLAQGLRPEVPCEVEPEIPRAWERALSRVGAGDLLCVTGSFYLAGEVAALWEERRAQASARRSP